MSVNEPELAYGLFRIGLGTNILLHGIVRWRKGLRTFSRTLTSDFSSAPLPPILVSLFGWILPIMETLIGSLLIPGIFTLPTLLAGTLLLNMLIIGKCLQSDWPTASLQLIYLVCYVALIWLTNANRYSLDYALGQ
ncbi:DoxX family protein [Spirosoma sp. SC4-14]|uniref:DoxX family protein n=1 Tax=Spirosoma sp. SC4-14 TaxID=3128900 RepID=UPI0030D0EA68